MKMKTKYYKKKTQKTPTEHNVLLAILRIPLRLILGLFHKNQVNNRDKKIIIKRWYWVREMLESGEDSDLRSAVIEADKLMDFALKSARFSGNKFSDRIRMARGFYSKRIYSGIWQAHILRNELVHNIDSKINSYQAKDAVKKVGEGLRKVKGL